MVLGTNGKDSRLELQELFSNLHKNLPALQNLLSKCSDHWGYEDPIYRFYHQSYKVSNLQQQTLNIVQLLQSLLPKVPMNKQFMQIVGAGTGKIFKPEDNQDWSQVTRPILEAFFHARFFLEMAVHYGQDLKSPPQVLPSGWAALLYLYNLR